MWLSGNFHGVDVIEKNVTFIGNISLGNTGLADSPPILAVSGGPFPGAVGAGAGIIIDRGVFLTIDNSKLGNPA